MPHPLRPDRCCFRWRHFGRFRLVPSLADTAVALSYLGVYEELSSLPLGTLWQLLLLLLLLGSSLR